MRKKQIYTLIGIILATILIVFGAWALKSGKFAGLADVIQQTTQKGILITTKETLQPIDVMPFLVSILVFTVPDQSMDVAFSG